jgi:threonine synthase
VTSETTAGSWLLCEQCGARFEELDARTRCPCDGLLRLEHSAPAERGAALQRRLDRPDPSGVWRFREIVLPTAGEQVVSYPEGHTPLIRRAQLAAWAGIGSADLVFKHEGMNPTGSFKDRGMTVALTQARRLGVRAVACASTGNTSASLAAYAAMAGLPALVLVPAGHVALGKLAQTLRYGARVLAVRGDFDACLRLLAESAEQLGLYLVNSVNPFRIEGQKTIVLELLAQRDWEAPDWIVLPGGNLGNTAAFGKALEEAHALELITRMPRLAVVQAEGAAPFAQAFRDGFRQRIRVEADTAASAIIIVVKCLL